jgi:hypothetical protein
MLRREVTRLRAAWDRTPESQVAAEADRQYQAFVAEHRTELAKHVEPAPAEVTADWHEAQARRLESEVERTASLVEDPSRPLEWEHQLALDDLQGFHVLYPDPPEAGPGEKERCKCGDRRPARPGTPGSW